MKHLTIVLIFACTTVFAGEVKQRTGTVTVLSGGSEANAFSSMTIEGRAAKFLFSKLKKKCPIIRDETGVTVVGKHYECKKKLDVTFTCEVLFNPEDGSMIE